MPPQAHAILPTFESQIEAIAAAEQGEGWLSVCEQRGHFVIPTEPFIAALAGLLRLLDDGPILEVCAGTGELAAALRTAGVSLVATDADPPAASAVVRASADKALRRYRPAVVLGSFVPIDSRVDRWVTDFASVRHYVVLGARIGGLLGSAALRHNPGWSAEPLEQVSRWMLTRHDVWLPGPPPSIVRHGEAWHFHRNQGSD